MTPRASVSRDDIARIPALSAIIIAALFPSRGLAPARLLPSQAGPIPSFLCFDDS